MAALNFPANPSLNDEYNANGATWRWNGTAWVRLGDPGAQGAQGRQGAVGAQGNQGRQGADGAQGAAGAQGAVGAQGDVGAQGAQGRQGSVGAQGDVGAQGNAGAQGAVGAQGAAGSATITNNADNRVITGGSGTNLNGEANLTFDGSQLYTSGQIQAGTTILQYSGTSTPYNNNCSTLFGTSSIGLAGQYSTINWPSDHATADGTEPWYMMGRPHGTTDRWSFSVRPGGSNSRYNIIDCYNNADGTIESIRFGTASGAERMRLDSSGYLRFDSGYGSVATAYGVRAWVNFNGSGTISIRESGNVGSITDEGTGDYRINFTNAMPDNEYAVAPCAYAQTGSSMVIVLKFASPSGHPMTTSWVAVVSENTSGRFDSDFVTVSVIR